MNIPDHPIAEIFGFPSDNLGADSTHYRQNRLCPFNNKVPSCTKDKARDPLGVCSIWDGNQVVITCPIRFREKWLVASDASNFFFKGKKPWTSLTEVRLTDKNGKSAGNIDVVLVAYDDSGKITDFGALEIQAVYINGNIREPFQEFMMDPINGTKMHWPHGFNYPRPNYLSSSRKRLAPQLIYKGGILNAWNKKIAVALQTSFFETLPPLPEVDPEEADVAWLLYDLMDNQQNGLFNLTLSKTVYTSFKPSLDRITSPEPGPMNHFVDLLQAKLDEKLDTPPDAPSILDLQTT